MNQLLPGTEVAARGLRWEVVFTQPLGPQTLCRLRGLEGALMGKELDLLNPFEVIRPIAKDFNPDRAGPLRNWLVYHQAFLLEQALGSEALAAVQPGRLRVEPYQLVPVIRALQMSRARLLLADGVGLGKTIQAGLVLTELIARRIAHRILIVTPAGPLLEQWKMEMSQRFGLRFTVIDRAKLDEIRRGTELGAIPFDHLPLGLASIDFLKQEQVLEELDRATYDVVVLDEAHHCMDIGNAGEREDSQRRHLAAVLARRCDSLILATATPHDGNDRSFASLCELLDPSLVDGRGVLRGDRYKTHVVRRLKSHIVDPVTRQPRFKERQVLPCAVVASPARHGQFVELQKSLLALLAPELRRAFRARRYSDVLAFISLLKRSVSSVEACRVTLAAVTDRLQHILTDKVEQQESRRQRLRSLRELVRKQERFGALTADEEAEQQTLQVEDIAQTLASLQRESAADARHVSRYSTMVESLEQLLSLADTALDQDPKLDALLAEIRKIRQHEPGANILIYTEYTDSQRAVLRALSAPGDLGVVLSMNGDDNEPTRIKVTDRFRSHNNLILVSTDAAAEGLNLHQRCHHLIHLELPFNPNRLEQRNGRIDRYGQNHDPIVRYLYLCGTFEQRILLRLIAKYERQRRMLTFVPNTLGITASSDAAAERLLQGLMDEDNQLFQREEPQFDLVSGDELDGADPATRELLEEIDRSLKGFERAATANSWLGQDGCNAEASLFDDADQALRQGQHLSTVDLLSFVRDAVLLDGGRVVGEGHVLELELPPAWVHGLDEVPGFDGDQRRIRLTAQLELTRDQQDQEVGFVGRAHPLVRRALDRVRHLSLGIGGAGQDPRISAVAADVPEAKLIFTCLGRVQSRAGRELERLLAVEVSASTKPAVLTDNEAWLRLAHPDQAVRTTDVWKTWFSAWATDSAAAAQAAAQKAFKPLAARFLATRRKALADERRRQDDWLQERSREIIGDRGQLAVQTELFVGRPATTPAPQPATWASLSNPLDRLAGFAQDRNQPSHLRHEANGVITLYKKRLEDLAACEQLSEPEIALVGILMVIPQDRARGGKA